MRLSERFGEPDVDAFMDRISPEQFVEWGWYYDLEAEEQKQRELVGKVSGRMDARTGGA